MSTAVMTNLLVYYNTEVSRMISDKYGFLPMVSLRKFLSSETYRMLSDQDLEMWDFSPFALFDMWENEQVTGDPRNSLYIRRD